MTYRGVKLLWLKVILLEITHHLKSPVNKIGIWWFFCPRTSCVNWRKFLFLPPPQLNKSTFYCVFTPKFSKILEKMAKSPIFFPNFASEFNKLSPARIGSEKPSSYLVLICLRLAQRSSAFIKYLVCLRLAQRSSDFIKFLVCLRLGFGILILIWIWSLVFYIPMIWIFNLYLDFEGAKNLHVL